VQVAACALVHKLGVDAECELLGLGRCAPVLPEQHGREWPELPVEQEQAVPEARDRERVVAVLDLFEHRAGRPHELARVELGGAVASEIRLVLPPRRAADLPCALVVELGPNR